ncbi:MAG: type II CAAX prenyl endopeptidase Rce1 family protein [Candidatus Hodarchaeota archaeon]
MRKIEIIEIENSFLNFFTPAVLVAISYFFFNIIGWYSLFFLHLLEINSFKIDLNLAKLLIYNAFLGTTCFSLYYLFIYHPRLKVRDAEFIEVKKFSFYVAFSFFFLLILSETVLTALYEGLFGNLDPTVTTLLRLEILLDNPAYLFLFLIYDGILSVVFIEIVYRRALIPMLEDRGLSPFFAVILSALGDSFINLPGYVLSPNHPENIYFFCLSIAIGLCAGLIYISTRNIIFPIISVSCFQIFTTLRLIGVQELKLIFESLYILFLVVGLGIILFLVFEIFHPIRSPNWIRIIKKRSSPFIMRGLIGFFIISLGLLAIQTIVAKIGRIIFIPEPGEYFPGYFIYISIFYAIAFTIPFFLTITTEWAKHPAN